MENRIKEYIDRNGLKTSFVLYKTGVSKSYLYDVMKGKTIPSLMNARKIADTLGVPLDELFPRNKLND